MKIGFYSCGRGGVGKTTASTIAALSYASLDKSVLLVDIWEYKNSSTYTLIGEASPPYVSNILRGECRWYEVVREITVSWEGGSCSLWLAPSDGELSPDIDYGEIIDMLRRAPKYGVDVIIIDFPSDPTGCFRGLLDFLDICCLVTEPDARSVDSIIEYSIKSGSVRSVPLLNKYHPRAKIYKDRLEEHFGLCFTVPFDPALVDLNKETLPVALTAMRKETQLSFARLFHYLLHPVEVRIHV